MFVTNMACKVMVVIKIGFESLELFFIEIPSTIVSTSVIKIASSFSTIEFVAASSSVVLPIILWLYSVIGLRSALLVGSHGN